MKIEIADSDFTRLQALAQPFVDTPATVVSRLLDIYEAKTSKQSPSTTVGGRKDYSLERLPPLTHTKVMDGMFAGSKPAKMNWDGFVRHALSMVMREVDSVEKLRRASGANLMEGKHEESGYKHVPELGFSFQGVSAEDAAKIIGRCARSLGVSFEIEFVWREKPDAHRPGERGRITFP